MCQILAELHRYPYAGHTGWQRPGAGAGAGTGAAARRQGIGDRGLLQADCLTKVNDRMAVGAANMRRAEMGTGISGT